jgi:hypothetical protein
VKNVTDVYVDFLAEARKSGALAAVVTRYGDMRPVGIVFVFVLARTIAAP